MLTSTNVAIGYVSGNAVSGGDNNVSIGTYSGTAVAGGNNVSIGSRAGLYATGNNNIAIGMDAGSSIGSSAAPVNDAIAFGNAAQATQPALRWVINRARRRSAGSRWGRLGGRPGCRRLRGSGQRQRLHDDGRRGVGRRGGRARQVINVAPGVQITDAVNLGQLQSAVSTLNQTINGLPPGGGGLGHRQSDDTPRHPQAAGTRRRRAAARWRRATPAPR